MKRWCLVLLLIGGVAWARPPRKTAAELWQQGLAALAAYDPARAYPLLVQGFMISPSAEGLLYLGRLAAAEGRVLEAQDLMRRYLFETTAPEDAPEVREAQAVLAQPGPGVPSGEVTVVGPQGALVLVDDRLVGALPLSQPLLLGAGSHRIGLEQGSRRAGDQVEVRPGRRIELRARLAPPVVVMTLLPSVILVPTWRGVAAEALRPLRQAVEEAAVRERVAFITPAAGQGAEQLARLSGAAHVLRVTVERGDAGWKLAAALSRLDIAEAAAQGERALACPGPECAPEAAAAALLQMLAETWHAGSERPSGTLKVALAGDGAGAAVAVDGRELGAAPLAAAVWAGEHQVTVRQPGHAPSSMNVNVAAGETAEVTAAPGPAVAVAQGPAVTPLAPLVRGPRPRWRVGLGAGLVGAGAAALGFGVAALAVDGQCIQAAVSPAAACKTLYNTRGLGGGLGAGGAALAAAGTVLLALPGPWQRARITTAWGDGPRLGLAGSF